MKPAAVPVVGGDKSGRHPPYVLGAAIDEQAPEAIADRNAPLPPDMIAARHPQFPVYSGQDLNINANTQAEAKRQAALTQIAPVQSDVYHPDGDALAGEILWERPPEQMAKRNITLDDAVAAAEIDLQKAYRNAPEHVRIVVDRLDRTRKQLGVGSVPSTQTDFHQVQGAYSQYKEWLPMFEPGSPEYVLLQDAASFLQTPAMRLELGENITDAEKFLIDYDSNFVEPKRSLYDKIVLQDLPRRLRDADFQTVYKIAVEGLKRQIQKETLYSRIAIRDSDKKRFNTKAMTREHNIAIASLANFYHLTAETQKLTSDNYSAILDTALPVLQAQFGLEIYHSLKNMVNIFAEYSSPDPEVTYELPVTMLTPMFYERGQIPEITGEAAPAPIANLDDVMNFLGGEKHLRELYHIEEDKPLLVNHVLGRIYERLNDIVFDVKLGRVTAEQVSEIAAYSGLVSGAHPNVFGGFSVAEEHLKNMYQQLGGYRSSIDDTLAQMPGDVSGNLNDLAGNVLAAGRDKVEPLIPMLGSDGGGSRKSGPTIVADFVPKGRNWLLYGGLALSLGGTLALLSQTACAANAQPIPTSTDSPPASPTADPGYSQLTCVDANPGYTVEINGCNVETSVLQDALGPGYVVDADITVGKPVQETVIVNGASQNLYHTILVDANGVEGHVYTPTDSTNPTSLFVPTATANPDATEVPTSPPPKRDQLTLEACVAQATAGNAKLATVNIQQGGSISAITGRGDLSSCYTQSGDGGTSLYDSIDEAVLEHAALQDSSIVMRGEDGNPLGVNKIQPGSVKLYMNPDAPVINGVYMPELTAEDVDPPIRPSTLQSQYIPGYVLNTNTMMFHAGDGWLQNISAEHPGIVYAPVSGKVVDAYFINNEIGWEITIKTQSSYEGKQVFYDVVHTDGLVDGLSTSSGQNWIEKGQPLAHIDKVQWTDGSQWWGLADIGFRTGPKGANATLSNFAPCSYFDPRPFFDDDFVTRTDIDVNTIRDVGNPIAPEYQDRASQCSP